MVRRVFESDSALAGNTHVDPSVTGYGDGSHEECVVERII